MKVHRLSELGVVFFLSWCLAAEGMAAETVQINFRDADIRSVIESVAEITGKSFVLDPRVKGKVTIISPQPIDSDLLYQAILSAIQVQGFQAVEDGAVTRIIPFTQSFNFAGGNGDNTLETEIIKVKYVQAATLVPVLKPLLSNGARLLAFAQSNYLVISDIRSNVDEVKRILRKLDDPDQTAVEVINLNYISAGEAVHIAGQLKQLQKQDLSLVEDGLNNRIIVSGPGIARTTFKNMLKLLDLPSTKKGSVEVIYLDYSRAAEIKPIIDGMLGSDVFLRLAGESVGDGKSKAATNYTIEIDELNNALVMAAPSAVIREIRSVVAKLDIARPQVLIEAVIAELSEGQARNLSSQLVITGRDRGGYLTNFDGVLSGLLGSALGGGGSDNAIASALPKSVIGVVGDFDRENNRGIGLLVQALKTDGRTKILSTPSVITLDNEEANLSVGEQVPFPSGSYASTNNSNSINPFTTVNREDVGVMLKVKPQISKGNAVRLEIEQESSKVKAGSADSQFGATTTKSTMQTNVMIQDGELLILGGLIEGQTDNSASKVPFLGDIPIIGNLFKSSSKGDSEKVLMMFIRPTIIRTPEDARALSKSKFEHLITRDFEGENEGTVTKQLKEFINQGQDLEITE
ncbi:MAG: type II secretion system secretin GspD [Porticoccaceae bacterium]|nr:type II secretion system secretin GspD [Porticoccaceae bacterium]MBT6799401.1 type II secretion system secretin GspD [Porticoccaceae bacterium]MBT7752315.1 type II secretion system secretin GspD [Porticoccaceae bacterium]